jgi:hypothetical protein
MSHQIDECEPRDVDVVAKMWVLKNDDDKILERENGPTENEKRPKSEADFDWIRFLYRFRCRKNIWIF